jgi:ribose transport system permease protein
MTTRLRDKILLNALSYSPIILFVVLFIIFGLLSPRFLQLQTMLLILNQASYIGILAVGMTFVLLTAGIDLSVGSIMYLSAVVAGLILQEGGPLILALLGCLLTGVIFGSINAFFITRFKVIPFVVTLSTLITGRGLGLAITQSRSINLPNSLFELSSLRPLGISIAIYTFLLVVLLAFLLLRFTPLGRHIYAVGNDATAATKAGLNVGRTMAAVYLISGFCAALAAFISIAQLGIVNPSFGQGEELDAISAAVLGGASLFGGVGTVFPGTLLGTLLIQMVQSGLVFARVDIFVQPLVQALVIFLAVVIDSWRNLVIKRLSRRNIRKETHVENLKTKVVS